MRFEQDTACRGTHCASTPQPSALQQRSRPEEVVVEEEEDSSAKDVDGQRRRLGIELEANVVEGANTGPRAEAGGPGMAYPAAAALAAASFYGPAHLPPTSSPGPTAAHHLQAKGILAGAHHHPHLNPHGITPVLSKDGLGA
ncbi:PREDICTED: uncharacterized protein LOC108766842 [Trachymyrmex cornetzi]|uniref:uncharacterized protein LOC108766842 n=1 Tax=Trachymyrmex cornetzi TaxID=471704 RepID=UPI00084F6BCB|nr:PREDICTED: uncharacterized protein LOC108766842 [Trachymyrmex cornetzi]